MKTRKTKEVLIDLIHMFQNTAWLSKENTYQSKYLELREINEISKLFLKCQCSKKRSKGAGIFLLLLIYVEALNITKMVCKEDLYSPVEV